MMKLQYHCAKKSVIGVAVALFVSAVLLDQACAQDFADVPSEWRTLASSEAMEVLDMLADQMKGNYEKIRTWDAVYQVHIEDFTSREALEWGLDYKEEDADEGLLQKIDCTMHIVIDFETDSVYWSRENPQLSWLKPGSREVVVIPGCRSPAERSVLSGEDYLYFDSTNSLPQMKDLPDHPEAQNKRVAYKEPTELVDKLSSRDLLDPRQFFGIAVSKHYWDYFVKLKAYAATLGDALKVLHADGPGGPWYRVSTSKQGGGLTTMTCSPAAGFNLVELVMLLNEPGEIVRKRAQLQWKQFEGIYLPAKVEIVEYVKGDQARPQILRVELDECVLNRPVDPQQFTYQALGLKDGDLVMDKVNEQFLIYKNGSAVKLADFGEKYVRPGEMSMSPRWGLMAVSVVVLVALVILALMRRRRARTV